jgi:SAM-dependent methyltransferase
MSACALCGVGATPEARPRLAPLIRDIKDYEYGVPWRSELWACGRCGLVVQEPRVAPQEIPKLYPSGYLAHSGSSRAHGVYGRLKSILGRREARLLARHVPQGGRVIEVGCGNGKLLSLLHDLRPDIGLAGVDIEDVGITGLPGFTFYHGQLEAVAIEPASFDAVYCSNLIEHVPDPLTFLKKCHEVLKPGGVIVGITPDHLSLDRYVFGRYWAGYHYPRHTFIFNHHNIRAILTNAGFEAIEVKGSHAYWYLSLANLLLELPGTRKRGLAFAAITALFAPLDLLINRFRVHGSMTFIGRRAG